MQGDTSNVNQKLVEEIAAPLYTVKELDIPTRMLTYYDKKGLLYQDKHEANNKRKFSITQAVWLKIVKDLFQFGFSSDDILHLKRRFEERDSDITLKADILTALIYEVLEKYYDYRILITEDLSSVMVNFSLGNLHDLTAFYFESPHVNIPLISKIGPLWKLQHNVLPKVLTNNKWSVDKKERYLLSELRKNKNIISFQYKPPRGEKRNGMLTTVERIDPSSIKSLSRYILELKHCNLKILFSNEPGKAVSIIKEQHKQIRE